MEPWCRKKRQYHSVPWNSMELWDSHFNQHHVIPDFYGIKRGIPWNSIEWPNKKSLSSMESGGRHYKSHRCSMEFHGIFHGIPWNSGAAKWHITLFHGIPWNIPWNSMELRCRQMKNHLVPWNSMDYSMEFHGTLEPPNDISLCSMEFHRTLTLTSYGILPWLDFQVIFNGIPGNSGVVK